MAEKDPDVRAFLDEFSEILEKTEKKTYLIHEDNILTSNITSMQKYDRVKALLMLKTISTVAGVYHFRAKHRFTGFAVNYLAETVFDEPADEMDESDMDES